MKNFIKGLIEDLKGDLFAIIMVVFFGVFIINDVFFDNGSSSPTEECAEHEEEQLVEAHLDELEREKEEAKQYAPLYYIDNGYYFHNDINCKGLDGYRNDDLNVTYPDELIEHQELSPCNWCVKGNN